MAIDTEDKRRSASDFYLFVISPVPDGSVGAADREQATGIYSGITISIIIGIHHIRKFHQRYRPG